MRNLISASRLALGLLVPALLLSLSARSEAQHLIWKPKPATEKATYLYGEIQVLATGPTIYYCGCNWWPGNPAGGYTGIQDAGNGRHLMIFSIWDTSPTLHPQTVQHEDRAKANRFGGEGEGAHTHLDYDWQLGQTYRFMAVKKQDAKETNTLTTVFFYDGGLKSWVKEATIASPNDGHQSVPTFGGMLNSFLENWSGQHKEIPKLALYRLWIGSSPDKLTNIDHAVGDGKWGVLNDTFFLAQGDGEALAPIFKASIKDGKPPVMGDKEPLTVKPRKLSPRQIAELERLAK